MSIAKRRPRFATVAELIRDLGVPADRIRMTPLAGTATKRDLIRINDRSAGLCELVDGTLVDKAMGYREGALAAILIEFIAPYVRAHQLGIITGEAEHGLRQGLVRLPDVAFVSWNQLPDYKVPEEAVPNLYPDLAIEVFSRGNTRKEMARKRGEYFRAGCRLVWIVYPKTKTIDVYTSPTERTILGINDTLDGDEVLPGFKLPVRTIFAPPPAPKSSNGKKK